MNINEIITQNGIIYDRYLGTSLDLPNSSFEDIKIKQNDTVTNFNLNNIITKLHENYLYLYKMSHVASNIMPIAPVTTIGVSGSQFSCYQSLSTSQLNSFASANITSLDSCDVLSVKYNPSLYQYVIFASSGPNLVVFNVNDSFTQAVTALSSNNIFDKSNIRWQRIRDFTFGKDNSLYVLDLSGNLVVRYNTDGVLTDDNILAGSLVYQNHIGGLGSYDDTTKFFSPESITYYDSNIYVLDSGNKCVKKYDSNLNWIITYRLFKDFLSAYPIQIDFDSDGDPYVVTNTSVVYKYDKNFDTKVDINLNTMSGDTGNIKQILFSPSDNNVFYLYTGEFIYKCLRSNPDDVVGKYLLKRFKVNTVENIATMTSISKTINSVDYDYNFIFSNSGGVGKILVYSDNINVVSMLTDNVFDVYNLNELLIHPEEYLQSWVINKVISKFLINHMRLRDEISTKFIYKKDEMTGDILLSDTRYLTAEEIDNLRFQQDITNYIGMNEIFQNNIINRPFEIIHNIQKKLLDALNVEVQDFVKSQIIQLG
jgi:hypothetical protein